MSPELREKTLGDIRTLGPYSNTEIFYKGQKSKMDVFDIPLDALIYNQYNGRISSLVKSYEAQPTHEKIDASSATGSKIIEEFLWHSHPGRNKKTLADLEKHGQLKYGIVTRDGIIIDGNRRASLLGRLAHKNKQLPGYFKAVILDDTLDNNAREIQRLETIYQMGEDEKLVYNAIEKYLKCKDLKASDFSNEEIAEMMNEPLSQIEVYLEIMDLMDEYLCGLGYQGIYTRLEQTEGPFVDLQRDLRRYSGGKSTVPLWQYDDEDVNELKLISFDYIRARFTGEGRENRVIGRASKTDGFFCNPDVWVQFKDKHFEQMDEVDRNFASIEQYRADHPGFNLQKVLEVRDADWTVLVDKKFKENIGQCRSRLANFNEREAPLKLLLRALDTLKDIDTSLASFTEDTDVKDIVSEINSITYNFKKLLKS